MPAPKGNKFAVGNKGTEKKFTPQQWSDIIEEYFNYCDNNPLFKNEALKSGDRAGEIIRIPTARPYLIEGLCNYANIHPQTFYNYLEKEGYEDYFEITARARNRIYQQNIEFGYVGSYDSNLVARKLGLADKKELRAELKEQKINLEYNGTLVNLRGI
jgi:hypothetical protein